MEWLYPVCSFCLFFISFYLFMGVSCEGKMQSSVEKILLLWVATLVFLFLFLSLCSGSFLFALFIASGLSE
ncbi:hypothetical protein HOY80DRAFT_605343 [Tuber brumale]|nr:hypothetical protein HOY80DRAFT_605343 [Tuber brumale]